MTILEKIMIIFIYGQDTFRSSQKLKQIIEKFKKEVDSSGMNLSILDGTSLKYEEFNQHVKASPFLASKRMIVIKNLITTNKSKDIQKQVAELLDQKSDQENIIIFYEAQDQASSKTKTALWKRLSNEKFSQEFTVLKPAELNHWIINEFKKNNITLNMQITNLLAAKVGSDLWQMSNEIKKIISYCKDKEITVDVINQLVKAKYDDDIFKLSDAIAAKNKKLALKLISDQLNQGANETYLLSMIIRQFRILMLVKDLQQINQQINQSQLAQQLKIHPYVAKKSLKQVNRFNLTELKKIYQSLLHIDLKIKTSSTKPVLLFDLLIAQL